MKPYFKEKGIDYYRIQGIDQSNVGANKKFYIATNASLIDEGNDPYYIVRKGQFVASGTLRNSLYLEPLTNFTSILNLNLFVDFEGAIRIKLYVSATGTKDEEIINRVVYSKSRKGAIISLPDATAFPKGARVFWHVDGVDDSSILYNMTYVTKQAPNPDCHLSVLLRTFGRTDDIKSIFRRFVDHKDVNYYNQILDEISFWLLDTSNVDVPKEYNGDWLKNLNVRIWKGANLGGGGNAGMLLKLFEEACDGGECTPTEILMLDDDLIVSMETLARYFSFCQYRAKDCICSLPVFMKSRPNVIWEDGGFWGRFNFNEGGGFSHKRTLFPTLLKHGLKFDGYGPLNELGMLNNAEYSTFIFFGLPFKVFKKLGYPVAFFLRGDDIEYSLRAGDHGVQLITNPNLTAWHEPGHSYWQEYMAILHAIIINFSYGDLGKDYYYQFFESRYNEHLAIDDLPAIDLYKGIIDSLSDPESPVLTKEFQDHYLDKMREFKKVKMFKLPEAQKQKFEEQARLNQNVFVPFVYPGNQTVDPVDRKVIIFNPTDHSYRVVEGVKSEDKIASSQAYFESLKKFVDNFDSIQKRWQERMESNYDVAWWQDLRDKYADVTDLLVHHKKAPFTGEEVVPAKRSGASFIKTSSARNLITKIKTAFISAGESANGNAVDKSLLPADFDGARYLELNPDVKEAGADPVKHYLRHGMEEGRAYI